MPEIVRPKRIHPLGLLVFLPMFAGTLMGFCVLTVLVGLMFIGLFGGLFR